MANDKTFDYSEVALNHIEHLQKELKHDVEKRPISNLSWQL